ncbi:OFA family MFS transporter [Nocardioidaceae bacterium]|nr:OFA family MFS transporter [Nocardioidaceae bacterium]
MPEGGVVAVIGILDKERTIAPANYNRWLVPPAALAIHLSIGQVYATSVYKNALVGVFDSSLTTIGLTFSLAIVILGLSAAFLGTWVDTGGPRQAMAAAAVFWGAGLAVAGIGTATEQIWLLFLGYGVLGGIGLGIGYISPVSTLIKWFPDRPGLATGLAIMGFGGGALVASSFESGLLGLFGAENADSAGSGAVAGMFLVMAAVYFVVMLFGAWLVRVPADDWAPAGFDPEKDKQEKDTGDGGYVTSGSVSANSAITTRQFYLVWAVLFCNVTAGIGILENAQPMIQDFFREGGSSSVSGSAAVGFVGILALANMLGRFVWSSTSDYIGRKNTYMGYLGIGALLFAGIALLGTSSTVIFVLFSFIIISFYGGGFATVPAYLRDLFGTFQVGAIHGRLLTAWAAAGVAGPVIVNGILDASGGEPGSLTADAYRPALFTMVGVLAVGFVANLLVTRVSDEAHEDEPKGSDRTDVSEHETSGGGTATMTKTETERDVKTKTPLLVFSWALVGIPLVYGLITNVIKAAALFTG